MPPDNCDGIMISRIVFRIRYQRGTLVSRLSVAWCYYMQRIPILKTRYILFSISSAVPNSGVRSLTSYLVVLVWGMRFDYYWAIKKFRRVEMWK